MDLNKLVEVSAELSRIFQGTKGFVIGAGGALLVHGLRDSTQDVDIVALMDDVDRLNAEGKLKGVYSKYPARNGVIPAILVFKTRILDEDVEMLFYPKLPESVLVHGVAVTKLVDILKFKQALNRPKDQDDIAKLQELLGS